jgi:2-keto-3-deoxy-6-phosphogluconate aldolase
MEMNSRIMTRTIEQIMRTAPVIPVIVIADAAHALPLAG